MSEIVYIGDYDNTNDLRLDADGTPISLSSVTRIDARVGTVGITSINDGDDPIRWNMLGSDVGEIRCKFGGVSGLSPGIWPCYFIVYEPTNPNGIVFGPVTLSILDIVVSV